MTYLARRLIHGVVVLLGVSLLSFALLELAPGNYFDEMRLNPQISPETVAALRTQYGMDRPLPVRYALWLRSVARGDWGYSFAYNLPVAPLLWSRALNTLWLTVPAGLLAWMAAVLLGVLAANRAGGWLDRLTAAGSSTLLIVPDLLLALLLLVVAVRTGIFPAGGMVSLNHEHLSIPGKIRDLLAHLILPVAALVMGTLPMFFRHVRTGMVEALGASSVQAARSLGLPRSRVLLGYALPLAANPLISLLGLSFATLLSGSLLVEVVMSWPGLGPMLLEAILARDLYLVIGAVMLSALFLVAGNFFTDIILYLVDPRIRTGKA